MPTNLGKAQQNAISSGFLNKVGADKDTFEIEVATNLLEQYGEEFVRVLAENIRNKGLGSSRCIS